ncbi:inorganic phosphate transporter [Legionella pneumophila]|uniref:Inorganic phosphate transporter, PiT family n=1 Tax=Legionella pneumophila subsp. pascullei TaxID=91890 RepID=A0AAX2IRW5_LEGPN|nr:inorganic phosphate transporter [Legionella pneumophila]AMP88197.1 inorganic phosphate transporter [Legionella pneumophila subsp. pascullei]AMP91106.1 inorganic phosphate transporter [Legionella pneumophila subsp. pascullei]AMP94093.1 inorganic phosphate transporter [Legionella pneumophila subsp. pascullei]SQG88865.1 inorganic phosphate transporter, PiT family [Legionella pneumophila subsp. pascullei]VEH03915.1 inorganic phosphate transporter, PiT family [Legionella pneumophila subsp. pascu
MDYNTIFILFVIFVAFVFDFINGFHDAANSIATIVTTGVLTPRQAVLWAAFFNFIAFLIFNLTVAQTIGYGLIDTDLVDTYFILAALMGAIFWNLVTWYYGLPSSSSHALIGGLAGAAIAKGGLSSLKITGFAKVAAGIFISPVLGLLIGLLFTHIFTLFLRHKNEEELNTLFKSFQLISSALLSITHGGNDAQKTMGIIAVLLFSVSWLDGVFYVPFWVVISCHGVISLGTLAGGWRIVHTMGTKITKLNTLKGCAAETGAAITIFAATEFGVPVSTTHTVTGSIAGVGLISGIGGAHWKVLRRIFYSWLLTIPAAALVAAAIMTISPTV